MLKFNEKIFDLWEKCAQWCFQNVQKLKLIH